MSKADVYTIHYTLKDEEGEVLESSVGDEPLSFLTGTGQIIPGLEKEILGLKAGDKKNIKVAAAEGYGEFDQEMVVEVPKAQFPKADVQVGDQFQADAGNGHHQIVVVTEVTEKTVTVDGNHPLAGQDLQFDVEIVSVRPATSEEIAHGHAHGPGGHRH